jgi:iron complex outermembrane recepter protein
MVHTAQGFSRFCMSTALPLVLGVLAQPALAQAAPAAAVTEDDIIVTAQKRSERLQDVPISISVQSGSQLEAQGVSTFMDMQSRVPNLSITDTPANASIFIRGIGTSGNTLSFEQSVSLFVDGIYGGRNRQFMGPFFDVERIEVLRGPQGALFGRNTSAGAISVTTRRPTDTFEGYVFADYETVRGSPSLQLAAGGPVTDTLKLRFAARYGNQNGWIDNVALDRTEPDRDDVLARGSLLWEPSSNFSLFAKVEYGWSDIVGQGFEFVAGGGRPDYTVDTPDDLLPIGDTSNVFNGTVQMDLGIGTHTLTAISGYSWYSYDQGFNIQAKAPSRLVTGNSEVFEQRSQEVRLASPTGGALDYILGGYVESSSSDIARLSLVRPQAPTPPFVAGSNFEVRNTRDFVQDTDVVALFGQANWSPIEQVKLTAGLRWTRIKKDGGTSGFNFTQPPRRIVPPFTAPPPTQGPRVPLDATITENDWSPNVSVTWQPTSAVSLYVRYAEGSKGGAFSETATLVRDFVLDPEQAEAWELGGKFSFPSFGGFLNIALFQTDYTNLQKSSIDTEQAIFVTSNAAGARTKGVEVEAGARPTDWLRLGGAIAYLEARYTDYPNGPCAFPRELQPNCSEDRTGDPLQNSPEWTGNVFADVDVPLSDRLRLIGSWTTTFRSDTNFQDILHPLEVQPAFSKTDVRAGLTDADRRWELSVLVRNLFDERTSGIIFQVYQPGTNPVLDRAHMPDPRRSITLQARYRF